MVVLTEELIIARTKQSNLASITKFNCWGSQISDVAILRHMPNVQVLSLSVNNIDTLVHFQHCTQLRELFVRKNNIKNLNEICYLQDLPNLTYLWLEQNPCVDDPKDEVYRYTVLRALPQLKKLDDHVFEPSDFEKAERLGRRLVHPDYQTEYYSEPDDDSPPPSQDRYQQESPVSGGAGNGRRPSVKQEPQTWQNPPQTYETQSPPSYQQQYYEQPPANHQQYSKSSDVRRNSINNHEIESETGQEAQISEVINVPVSSKNQTESSSKESAVLTPSSPSLKLDDQIEDYSLPISMRSNNQYVASIPRSRTTDGELGHCNDFRRHNRSCITTCPGTRRPPDRKTNVLNAVLCLIKELDYHNLEVVEMAVKCRMDELEG